MDNAHHRGRQPATDYNNVDPTRTATASSNTLVDDMAAVYQAFNRVSLANPTANAPAPPHTAPRGTADHVYSLYDSRNVPWATLRLASTAASPRYLPSYFEGQTISGAVELNVAKPDAIQAVTVTLSGKIVATNANPLTFWELTHVLWTAEMGNPHTPFTGPSTSRGKSSAKLSGSYTWPFAMPLPSSCNFTLRSKHPPVQLRLPPSFSEKGAAQFINYDITVRIRRGAFRVDSKLGTQFGYTPRIRPHPPSFHRRIAYQDDSPIPGPDTDPDGWEILPSVPIHGRAFGVRPIEAFCTIALAVPLTYTRGSPIPLKLTLACTDLQALELFSPASMSVHLIREVAYDVSSSLPLRCGPADLDPVPSPSSSRIFLLSPLSRTSTSSSRKTFASSTTSLSVNGQKISPKLSLRHARKVVASAVWWESHETPTQGAQRGIRRFDGEILLPRDVPPSFTFGGFSVKYSIGLLPFHMPGFEAVDKEPTFLTNIDVATLHPHGVTARSYAPPGHEAQRAAHQMRVTKPIVWGLYNTSGQADYPP